MLRGLDKPRLGFLMRFSLTRFGGFFFAYRGRD